ncbi:MAG: CBS domain-containing protein [Microcoleaceae cyanobacterium]
MHLILCHTTADFDALGAAVGVTKLCPGSKIVLTRGCHPSVRDFLALHRNEFAMIEQRSVIPEKIRQLTVVDTQSRERLAKASEWFNLPQINEINVYDHHLNITSDIPATTTHIEAVGATTTIIVEQIIQQNISNLSIAEATVMALGIHADTGSLTFAQTTPREARALAWLMERGANLSVIAEYIEPGLSPQLQDLLIVALNQLKKTTFRGFTVSWVLLKTDQFIPGLSSLISQILELTESDAVLLGNRYLMKKGEESRFTIIGRSRIKGTDLNQLFQPLGGGGHSQAASVVLREVNSAEILQQLVDELKAQIPQPLTAREIMSSPVRTIRPDTTIAEAHRILLRYGHSGLSIVNQQDQLVGIISRRDLDIALHHGFSHAPVKGYMARQLKTIKPETTLPEIESLMVTYDIGRLPILEADNLVGIVTRTDVLRQLHQQQLSQEETNSDSNSLSNSSLLQSRLKSRINPHLLKLLEKTAQLAEKQGLQLYLVGGAVRDLLLAKPDEKLLLTDLDLVVDGCHHQSDLQDEENPAAVLLGKALQQSYSGAKLEIHGQFKTAALLWHNDPIFDSLWIDIATARTEFYPYPAANPEVEASSIRQDLYRRDFTINALALRLTSSNSGELLDFFGGIYDLQNRLIRVLHANSFIEDPTRIYRAVRFAVRLGFEIETQTKDYIDYAISSGVYENKWHQYSTSQTVQKLPALENRLKSELKYILQASYWQPALQLLGELKALRCIHPTLELDRQLWRNIRLVDRCLRQFDPKQQQLTHWQMRLDVILAHLAPQYRQIVAEALQLPSDDIQQLQQLEQSKTEINQSIYHCQRPSQFVQLFKPYNLPLLILISVQSSRFVRQKIWQYLTKWCIIKPLLNGNDLKALGYKPSRQFKQMLEEILAATLDGEVSDPAAAIALIQSRYPLSTS